MKKQLMLNNIDQLTSIMEKEDISNIPLGKYVLKISSIIQSNFPQLSSKDIMIHLFSANIQSSEYDEDIANKIGQFLVDGIKKQSKFIERISGEKLSNKDILTLIESFSFEY